MIFFMLNFRFSHLALQNAYFKKSIQTADDQNMKKDDQNTKKRSYQKKGMNEGKTGRSFFLGLAYLVFLEFYHRVYGSSWEAKLGKIMTTNHKFGLHTATAA